MPRHVCLHGVIALLGSCRHLLTLAPHSLCWTSSAGDGLVSLGAVAVFAGVVTCIAAKIER
jgi:hypothetical protein